MSHWDGHKIIRWPTVPCEKYPAWDEIDCGCCHGIKWGGEYPIECDSCDGTGIIYKHRKSGVTAVYPGGRFT